MNHLFHLLPLYWLRPMGWVLVHALWQVALVALLYRGVSLLSQRRSPRVRYGLGCAALVACLALPLATFAALAPAPGATTHNSAPRANDDHHPVSGPAPADLATSRTTRATSGPLVQLVAAADPWMPSILVLWALGAAVGLARLGLAARRASLLARRDTKPAPTSYVERLGRLRRELGVQGSLRLRLSERTDSPALIGWWRPVILLPTAASRLAADALGPVLAHELAHIRRRDYPANLLQSALERLFFFHPLVHWISAQVRAERELCCDDVAAQACEGGPVAYARGLASLEALRVEMPSLAATEGDLMARIRRLVDPPSASPRRTVLGSALLLGCGLLAGGAEGLLSRSATATVLDGLDPVGLVQGNRTAGSANLSVEHGGYRYLFANVANRERFLSDPQQYSVRNVAICPISGRRVRTDIFRVVDGNILLFCCPEVGDFENNRGRADAVLGAALSGG